MNRICDLLTVSTALLLVTTAQGVPNRGLWFWGSTTLPGGASSTHGSSDVVGDGPEEDAAIIFMTNYGVKRVFGSYQNRPVSEPSVIAAWNAKLDAAGIDSQLLIEGSGVNNTTQVASIQAKITNRLINFNNSLGSDTASKFDALHLDLEPQQLDLWKDDAVGTDKRALLTDLSNVYSAIRTQLDDAGFTSMPIYADINFSWDKLPAAGGSVAWTIGTAGTGEIDRDSWYAGLSPALAGLSIMTFSKSTASALEVATAFERSGVFPGSVVVGIQPRTGVGELWANHSAFYSVMSQLEINIGTLEATDIENYAYWRHAVATTIPVVAPAPEIFLPATGTGGGTIWVDAWPGYKHTVQQSDSLGQTAGWRDVQTFTSSFPDRVERFALPISADKPRDFWRIAHIPLP